MKIKCMYNGKLFTQKPQGFEIAQVQNNLSQTEIDIEDLANGLSHGATFKPALLNGRKSADWISQQLFALDFDHGTTIQNELSKCSELGILPCFGYTSFSHSENEHRFRLVFCTPDAIADVDIRNKLQLAIISAFPNSDIVTKDCTRIFFGGRSLISNDFESRIDGNDIISKYYVVSESMANNKRIKAKNADKSISPSTANYESNSSAKVEAISKLDVAAMQLLLGQGVLGDTDNIDSSFISININPHLIFKCQNDLYNHINSIDLEEFIGIGSKLECCILPNHDDSTPSAHVINTDSGTQVYKCFGCNKSRSIIGMVEELADCKRSEAIEYIKSVYNLKLEQSDWTIKQKQLMIDSANYLDKAEFKETFPELSKLIRTRKLHIQKMLMHFTEFVNEDIQADGKPLFFAGYNALMDICEIKGNRNTFSQSITLFTLLNMLDKVALENIPERELTKAKAIAAKYGHKKLTNFYGFEEYGIKSLNASEDIAKNLKQNNITLKGLSREYVLRTFGAGLADKVYPQYRFENAKGTTNKSDEHTAHIVECVFYLIEKQNYATEKEIVTILGSRYQYQATEIQIKRSIQEVLTSYCLKRVRANKELKQTYCIAGDGYPFIIVTDE